MTREQSEAHKSRKQELADLRKTLREARIALRDTHKDVRLYVKEARAQVQAYAREMRSHVVEELRATIRADEYAAQAAHAARLNDIGAIDSGIEQLRARVASREQLRKDLAAAKSAHEERRNQAPAITGVGVRQETDDEVRQHLPEGLIPLFEQMKRRVSASTSGSRTETFLAYALAHPAEVAAAAKDPTHLEVAQLEKMEVKLSTEIARHEEKANAEAEKARRAAEQSAAEGVPTSSATSGFSLVSPRATQRTGRLFELSTHRPVGHAPITTGTPSRRAVSPMVNFALTPSSGRTPDRTQSYDLFGTTAAVAAPAPVPITAPPVLQLVQVPEPSVSTRLAGATATYDPGDNKLRLRSPRRLDSETYKRVKAAGFSWAPKQDLFFAPAWTPEREALLVELCGEIGDEDTSLVDRAEERAERFDGYRDRRAEEAAGAHRAVEEVSKRFEFGQPILVGHHSERKARKDAERIESGMRKAVSLWNTSKYWEERAKGALRHAKYKERADVRHRRIKAIESERRKQVRAKEEAIHFAKLWAECSTLERALAIANYDHLSTPEVIGPDGKVVTRRTTYWSALKDGAITVEWARTHAIQSHEAKIRRCEQWIEHIDHRLAYERAMLGESGGIAASKFDLQVGGQVLSGYGWSVILRLNRKAGEVVSVTASGKFGKKVYGLEEIQDYKPPAEGDTAKVAAATKLAPLVNFPGAGFVHLTQAQWTRYGKSSDFYSTRRVAANEMHGAYRLRMAPKGGGSYDTVGVYITDARRVDPPPPSTRAELPARAVEMPSPTRVPKPTAEPTVFDAMAQSLKAGVKVVSADQLFPTPPELARRVVALASIQPGERVLEPSAGTGSLLSLVLMNPGVEVVAVEVSASLARALAPKPGDTRYTVRQADFLTLGPSELGTFDVVVMNPPFAKGADVKHILHARKLLNPGGRLVALCANGPRQQAALRYLSYTWEELPDGSFKSSGTNVRTVLLTMRAIAVKKSAPKRASVAARKGTTAASSKRKSARKGAS